MRSNKSRTTYTRLRALFVNKDGLYFIGRRRDQNHLYAVTSLPEPANLEYRFPKVHVRQAVELLQAAAVSDGWMRLPAWARFRLH